MDSANWHFGGLSVTETIYMFHKMRGQWICFASGSLLSMQLEIAFVVASETYNLYFWTQFQKIMQAPMQFTAHVSKPIDGGFHWVVDCLFSPLLWRLLRRMYSPPNLYPNYKYTEICVQSLPSHLPLLCFIITSSLPGLLQLQNNPKRHSQKNLSSFLIVNKRTLDRATLNPQQYIKWWE